MTSLLYQQKGCDMEKGTVMITHHGREEINYSLREKVYNIAVFI